MTTNDPDRPSSPAASSVSSLSGTLAAELSVDPFASSVRGFSPRSSSPDAEAEDPLWEFDRSRTSTETPLSPPLVPLVPLVPPPVPPVVPHTSAVARAFARPAATRTPAVTMPAATVPLIPLSGWTHFEKDSRLDADRGNAQLWMQRIKRKLMTYDLTPYLDGSAVRPADSVDALGHANWGSNDRRCAGLLLENMTEPEAEAYSDKEAGSAKTLWDAVIKRHNKAGPVSQAANLSKLLKISFVPGSSHSETIQSIKTLVTSIFAGGAIDANGLTRLMLLHATSEHYQQIRDGLDSRLANGTLTTADIIARMELAAQREKDDATKENKAVDAHAASLAKKKTSHSDAKGKGRHASEGCYNCGGRNGHISTNCPQPPTAKTLAARAQAAARYSNRTAGAAASVAKSAPGTPGAKPRYQAFQFDTSPPPRPALVAGKRRAPQALGAGPGLRPSGRKSPYRLFVPLAFVARSLSAQKRSGERPASISTSSRSPSSLARSAHRSALESALLRFLLRPARLRRSLAQRTEALWRAPCFDFYRAIICHRTHVSHA
jgi:hypothetical protein